MGATVKYMTADEARQLIRDAIASGLYKPGEGFLRPWLLPDGVAVGVTGCALCGLYIGCGGYQFYDNDDPFFSIWDDQRLFLTEVAGASMADVLMLECGYEGYDYGSTDDIRVDADMSSPWYQLGRDLREGKL